MGLEYDALQIFACQFASGVLGVPIPTGGGGDDGNGSATADYEDRRLSG
jgi:hypothetical protein